MPYLKFTNNNQSLASPTLANLATLQTPPHCPSAQTLETPPPPPPPPTLETQPLPGTFETPPPMLETISGPMDKNSTGPKKSSIRKENTETKGQKAAKGEQKKNSPRKEGNKKITTLKGSGNFGKLNKCW